MSRWAHLWSHLRFREATVLARTFQQRTQTFVHKLYDSAMPCWLRANRRTQYARMMACVRAVLDTPRRRALMLSATGIYKSRPAEDECGDDVTNEELQELMHELERTHELSRATLYCTRCSLRLIIDTRHDGIKYCTCNNGKASPLQTHDGWSPYMETQDVIIWRKEHPQGTGLYMYKVYGRYAEVSAADFASVQTDFAYRRVWDDAVASLYTVERRQDSSVIHWEVVWPRLFANRDYVYVRRHQEFTVNQVLQEHEPPTHTQRPSEPETSETQPNKDVLSASPPSTAKRKAEPERLVVIVSKSCSHPHCPVSRNAIRVTEYWSNMVIRTLNGANNKGMEFALTYYDQPAAGGMPRGVAAWATGRAAPEYLARIRRASADYAQWLQEHPTQQEECFEAVSAEVDKQNGGSVREEDMEVYSLELLPISMSSQRGPIMDLAESTRSRSPPAQFAASTDLAARTAKPEVLDVPREGCEEQEESDVWWRYLFPFYYFA